MTEREEQTPQDWWSTSIIDMSPGVIRYRGYAIEDLIGRIGFAEMIWLLTRGELPDPRAAKLLECALVAAVDHGPQAPSIAIARMAMTCGVGINTAMASAINVLGDVHGGAGEQCVALFRDIRAGIGDQPLSPDTVKAAVIAVLEAARAAGVTHVPGFGHRFHPVDPRTPRLLALVDEAVAAGVIGGDYALIARTIENVIAERRQGRRVPMNIDGATAVIFAELGFDAPLCRGLFVLSRSVGTLAHAWEESQSGARNKGPIPRHLVPTYTGPGPRKVGG